MREKWSPKQKKMSKLPYVVGATTHGLRATSRAKPVGSLKVKFGHEIADGMPISMAVSGKNNNKRREHAYVTMVGHVTHLMISPALRGYSHGRRGFREDR